MGSLLSLVSGQFTRSLIFGAFFPVVLFLVAALTTIEPLLPHGLPGLQTFQGLDKQWEVLAFSFVAIVLTVFLYNLNIPIVRLFEGYPWRDSRIGDLRTQRYRRSFEALLNLVPRLRMTLDAMEDRTDPRFAEMQSQLDRLDLMLHACWPSEGGFILPTRFGNVIRSFESYPQAQYGIDGVVAWPRLVNAIPKDALTGVDEARSAVDFFLNSSLLSALLAAALFAVGCWTTNPRTPVSTLIRWPLETAGAALCAFLLYEGAIDRAAAWGGEVKSLFDLYRWDLLKKIGYKQIPGDREGERKLWRAIMEQVTFGDSPYGPPMPYQDAVAPGNSATTEPAGLDTELSIGLKRSWWGFAEHICRVRNIDGNGRRAEKLKLKIALADGTEYVWGSAHADGRPCTVSGRNPLSFDLGPLPAGESIDVVWQVTR